MKKTYFTWLGLFCLLAVAEASPVLAKDSKNTEETLLSAIFPSRCNFSGHFSQRKAVEGVSVPLNSTGDFFYSCDLGLVWHTSKPFSEAVLYVNSTNNFKAEDDGTLTPLTGITRYIMSNIFVRLLNGDTAYFAEEFSVTEATDKTVRLHPESGMLQKGLDVIHISKTEDDSPTAVSIKVTDVKGQDTLVLIDHIQQYSFTGKRSAYEQCNNLYADKTNWCQVLRSPSRFDVF